MTTESPRLTELVVADAPELWADLGFSVDDGSCVVGGVRLRLAGADVGRGVTGWAFDDIGVAGIDGVPTASGAVAATDQPAHRNGVTAFDHVVLRSPDVERTGVALAASGFDERRRRNNDFAGNEVDMRFFMSGRVVIELVGPPSPDQDDTRPARLWGLAFTCDDLDATADHLGDRCTTPRDAVQPGRRICALRREAGSSVPIAFMSPHVKA